MKVLAICTLLSWFILTVRAAGAPDNTVRGLQVWLPPILTLALCLDVLLS